MIVIFLLLFLTLVRPVYAIYDPTSVPNNKYGIHIADFNDIADIPALINSSGGDWGYVTLVSTDNDRDHGRWQTMFDAMRRLHLIPIVRIATHTEGDYWVKPKEDSFDSIIAFFNDLNWPIQNRYVVLFNEPNHGKEWGNTVDPEGYADSFVRFAQKFQAASSDYFVLPAGLDVSAATDATSLDAFQFLKRVVAAKPEFLDVIDGWTSHSYPNPGFSGSPYAVGRGTIRSYATELSLLQNLGLAKQLPIFITETGWVHNRGKYPDWSLLSPEAVGENIELASYGAWNDPRIVAITPFLFNYQDVPFDIFSWKILGNGGFYPQYYAYQSIPKTKGEPIQNEEYVLSDSLLPPALVADSSYTFSSTIVNRGQGICDPEDGYALTLVTKTSEFTLASEPLPVIEPNEKNTLTIHVKTPSRPGTYRVSLVITHHKQEIPIQTRDITVVPPPSIVVRMQLGWRKTNEANDVRVMIYDGETLLHTYTGLAIRENQVSVSGLSDIVPGKTYRVVAVVPYYLPRQSVVTLASEETNIDMKRFLPFDLNGDGALGIADLVTLFRTSPKDTIRLFVGP
jgi:hypothetical protein